jgi:hypothetical protein
LSLFTLRGRFREPPYSKGETLIFEKELGGKSYYDFGKEREIRGTPYLF